MFSAVGDIGVDAVFVPCVYNIIILNMCSYNYYFVLKKGEKSK
jgi:hypothetical protein